MRRIQRVAASAIGAMLCATFAVAQLPSDVIFYVDFENAKPDELIDHSANNLVLKAAAGKATIVDGKYGKAAQFDAKTAFQAKKAGDVAKLKDKITVGAWVKPKTLTAWTNLIEMDAPAGARANKAWKTGFDNAKLVFTTYEVKDHSGTAGLALDKWQHVAYSYDGKAAKLYIDGKLDSEVAGGGTFDAGDAVVTTIDIGWRSTTSSAFFDGVIDDLWIANVVKSEKEIAEIMGGISLAVDVRGKSTTTWGALKARF